MSGRRDLFSGLLAVAVIAVALALSATPARAVFNSSMFATLRADLQHRVDNELATPADKAAKKRRKACDKSLKLIDKSAEKLSNDAKTAGKCAGFVAKPFAEEFAPGTGKLADMGDTFANLADAMTSVLDGAVGDLNSQAEGLDDKTAKKVRKQATKAGAALQAADQLGDNYKKRFGKLAAAAKAVEKGKKTADKSILKAKAKLNQVIATIDGERFVSDPRQIIAEFGSNDDAVRFFGSRARSDGGTDELDIRVGPVLPGPGSHALADLECVWIFYTEKPSGGPNVTWTALTDRGVFVLDEANNQKASYRARFACTLRNFEFGFKNLTNGAANIGAGEIFGRSTIPFQKFR